MKHLTTLILLLFAMTACSNQSPNRTAIKKEIAHVLDDWHNAAAEGDFERYFSHFAGDSAIYWALLPASTGRLLNLNRGLNPTLKTTWLGAIHLYSGIFTSVKPAKWPGLMPRCQIPAWAG